MKILRKPWWLKPFSGDTWTITIWPNIYPEAAYWDNPNDPKWVPLIAHEMVHLKQQAGTTTFYPWGKLKSWWWELGYLLFKNVRLAAELPAYAKEIQTAKPDDRDWRYWQAVHELAGPGYGHCAPDEDFAAQAILACCKDLGLDYHPGPKP